MFDLNLIDQQLAHSITFASPTKHTTSKVVHRCGSPPESIMAYVYVPCTHICSVSFNSAKLPVAYGKFPPHAPVSTASTPGFNVAHCGFFNSSLCGGFVCFLVRPRFAAANVREM